jgi:hypothetical protein
MAARKKEVQERLTGLTPAEQERAPGDVPESSGEPVRGESGRNLLRFAGIWTEEEADQVSRAIEEGCETIDLDSWKMDANGW